MKNIHILPTENPSSLFEIDGHLIINKEQLIQPKYYRNIYITSDEEVKEGDWYCSPNGIISKHNGTEILPDNWKKIILTTDQDLIKDGVQAIDDEFLEWLVENPSCEFIEIEKEPLIIQGESDYFNFDDGKKLNSNAGKYKIIIPQEEPKQETLEEAAERLWLDSTSQLTSKNSFIQGAKWQQERMYSEEEVEEIIKLSCEEGMLIQRTINDKVKIPYTRIKDFTIKMFEQFKKK
jgi:hypothetical protein